ncbi:MAG: VCBS repeat-containing protein, partial [Polyangiaceae bacterium]
DGFPDLAATNSVDRTLVVFMNAGNGTFLPPTIEADEAFAVAMGDFDGDGRVDLATISATADETASHTSTLRLLFNTGAGTFQPAASYQLKDADALEVGELNGDGLPDLVVLGPGNAVSVLLSTCK